MRLIDADELIAELNKDFILRTNSDIRQKWRYDEAVIFIDKFAARCQVEAIPTTFIRKMSSNEDVDNLLELWQARCNRGLSDSEISTHCLYQHYVEFFRQSATGAQADWGKACSFCKLALKECSTLSNGSELVESNIPPGIHFTHCADRLMQRNTHSAIDDLSDQVIRKVTEGLQDVE